MRDLVGVLEITKEILSFWETFYTSVYPKLYVMFQKLQHLKVESEREVANLKRTVAELQQKLASSHKISTAPATSLGPAPYKKRRF